MVAELLTGHRLPGLGRSTLHAHTGPPQDGLSPGICPICKGKEPAHTSSPAASPWERARTPEQCGYWSRTSPQPLLCPGLPRAQAGWEDWEDFQGPGRPCRSGSLGASRRELKTRHSCVGEGPDEGIVRDSGATGILRAGHLGQAGRSLPQEAHVPDGLILQLGPEQGFSCARMAMSQKR